MRLVLILAFSLSVAGAAHAQFESATTIPGIPGVPGIPGPPGVKPIRPYQGYRPPKPYQPYNPATSPSIYADGPFSPGGEAKRQRREDAAERARANGAFSPSAEAKRQREEAKRNATINPF